MEWHLVCLNIKKKPANLSAFEQSKGAYCEESVSHAIYLTFCQVLAPLCAETVTAASSICSNNNKSHFGMERFQPAWQVVATPILLDCVRQHSAKTSLQRFGI